jgi:hypothetical protein
MRFYYNIEMCLCVDEDWLVWYLIDNELVENEDEALDELHSRREFCGWFECEVSNTIADKFEVQLIGY